MTKPFAEETVTLAILLTGSEPDILIALLCAASVRAMPSGIVTVTPSAVKSAYAGTVIMQQSNSRVIKKRSFFKISSFISTGIRKVRMPVYFLSAYFASTRVKLNVRVSV